MNYLLFCKKDHSYIIVNKTKLIHDDTQPLNEGDVVPFFYKKEKFEGKIERISDDTNFLKQELKRLKKEKNTTPKPVETRYSGQKLGKRQPVAKKVWTPATKQPSKTSQQQTDPKKKRQKIISLSHNVSQERVRRLVTREKEGQFKNVNRPEKILTRKRKVIDLDDENEENIMQGRIENRRKITLTDDSEDDDNNEQEVYDYDEGLGAIDDDQEIVSNHDEGQEAVDDDEEKASNHNEGPEAIDDDPEKVSDYDEDPEAVDNIQEKSSDHNDNTKTVNVDKDAVDGMIDEELRELIDPKQQLIGLTSVEKMQELKNGILCLKNVYDSAIGSSTQGTHLARRLMLGVFTLKHILRSTYSGAPPHAQGTERLKEKVICLNNEGKQAIHDFVINHCEKMKWKVSTKQQLQAAMSQRIGEIKRQHRMNQSLNDE